ncbi:MAG: polymer-forming cytoskeletal protein [Chthoniobacterales bacterium]
MSIFSTTRKAEPSAAIASVTAQPDATARTGAILSSGVSIKGSVKFLHELQIDGEVEGTINSTGTLRIGEHGHIRGEVRTRSVAVQGTVDGNVFVTERCELQAGCTLRGDIEAPRLIVDEEATFLGSARIAKEKRVPSDANSGDALSPLQ